MDANIQAFKKEVDKLYDDIKGIITRQAAGKAAKEATATFAASEAPQPPQSPQPLQSLQPLRSPRQFTRRPCLLMTNLM